MKTGDEGRVPDVLYLMVFAQIMVGLSIAVAGVSIMFWTASIGFPSECKSFRQKAVFVFGYVMGCYVHLMVVFALEDLVLLAILPLGVQSPT